MSEGGEPLIFYPGKLKWFSMLAICAGFVAIGVFVMVDAPILMRALIIGFFGIGIPLSLAQMFGGISWLKLDEDGFEFSQFGRKFAYRWLDVSEFGVWKMKQGFLTTSAHVCFSTEADAGKAMGKVNQFMTGGTGSLPDTYGMSARKLAELMNTWRDIALSDQAYYHPE